MADSPPTAGSNKPLVEPPIVAKPTATTNTTQPELAETPSDETSFWRAFLYSSPTWGISTLVHIILVLALTLYTATVVEKPGSAILTASMDVATEIDQATDVLHKPVELELTKVTLDTPTPSDSPLDVSDAALAPEKIEISGDQTPLTDLGFDQANGLLDEIGSGMNDKLGAGNAATFFGVPSKGKKFCFVVDNSNSMRGTKFREALYELEMAVGKLSPTQSFYIIFFSDRAYPMFDPTVAPAPILATPQNKQLVSKWLPTVENHLKTKGSEAMKLALDLNPDVIYVLGDGAFTDNTVKELMAREYTRTKIHTIGFNMKAGSRPAQDFEAIAKKFYGTYREVNEKK